MPPAPPATEFAVRGMNCQGCVRHVADAIQSVPGVETAVVDLASARATVRWKSGATPANDAVTAAVKAAGYGAGFIPHSAARTPHAAAESWRASVLLGAAATIPLMIGEWVFGLGMERWWHWTGFALALPTQVFCGGRFYRGAWRLLKAGGANMDTLVALGSTTAFAYSVFGLFAGWHTHLYFMEAASIITVVSAGHWMESLASAKAASALRALLSLAPHTARKLDAAGAESEVPVASLRAEDRVALRPGDRVPVDGDVLEGASAVDEAMLTGESLPVEKSAGAKLFTGTVNQNGRLVMRVTATGESTALAHIISVVQHAQASRANIQKLGDRVSAVFVPVVAVAALATGLWWGLAFESAKSLHTSLAAALWMSHLPGTALAAAFIHAAAVLIVACPCAMGLATPAAIMAGTNAAARRGILIRDGLALEKCGTITAVLFDKTGTLTQGKLAVAATHECGPPGRRQGRLAPLAAALAGPSNHPLSRAVASGLKPTDEAPDWHEVHGWREVRGSGVEMILDDEPARLGSPAWLRECGVDFTPADGFVAQWTGSGATVLGVARGNKLVGAIALRDALKSRAGEVVRELTAGGRRICLVTGDNTATARAIAAQAGIAAENVFAGVRPERKAEIVRDLQSRGGRVAFVGDGINDAPALEQADLGVAVSRASDVAREAADIVLLRSDIEAVPEALGLAQATLRTIRQNLFWAFFYNAAAVPLAALGFISPILCAAAMGASDVVVIGNALRLARWRHGRRR